MADPGFPVGGDADPLGGANLRRVHFLVKMYAKMKEIDPVGGGGAGGAPLDPPMLCMYAWLPIGLENRENLQKRESIFQTGKVGGKTGNFTQNSGKIMTF